MRAECFALRLVIAAKKNCETAARTKLRNNCDKNAARKLQEQSCGKIARTKLRSDGNENVVKQLQGEICKYEK